MNRNFKRISFFLYSFSLSIIFSQPESQFNPFDWVQYRKTGNINSISYSNTYLYLGSENGGILRFNLFSERFEEPITIAQGLKSNSIKALHLDSSGSLWVATRIGLDFSLSAEGDWRHLTYRELNIPSDLYIEQIGESIDAIWIKTSNIYYRLDRINGIILESMLIPNQKIIWSSKNSNSTIDFSSIIINYSLLDGWLYDLESLISPNGRKVKITTYLKNSEMNDLWIGTEEGYFFKGDNTMKTLRSFQSGLAGNHIYDIAGEKSFWLGGRLGANSYGISFFNQFANTSDLYLFDENINMDRTSIYSILEMKNEVWFGGNGVILSFNKKNNYWKTIQLNIANPDNQISSLMNFQDQVWFGSYNGLHVLDFNAKKIKNDILKFFENIIIYDLAIKNHLFFIATEIGLHVYDLKNNKLFDYKDFGYKTDDFLPPIRKASFTDLLITKRNLYAANQSGIISFNFRTRQWSNAVDASIFGGLRVKSMAIDKDIIFLSTIDGIIKFDMRRNFMNIYNYSFIGQVNDMYINGRKLWLGTSKGLVSFKFK